VMYEVRKISDNFSREQDHDISINAHVDRKFIVPGQGGMS